VIYVTSYINPDTDGVAAALGYVSWARLVHRRESKVAMFGKLQAETVFALEYTAYVDQVSLVDPLPDNCNGIVLVDTHHPNQLHPSVNFQLVTEIIDHHPAGSSESFPNAVIQNEPVGAAATLLAERLAATTVPPNDALALLLATAIYSNTLGLRAPATVARDLAAFKRLTALSGWPDEYVEGLKKAQRDELADAGIQMLVSDAKEFDTNIGKIVVFQIERPGIIGLFSETEIVELLRIHAIERKKPCVLVIVDLSLEKTNIYSTSSLILDFLFAALPRTRHSDGHIEIDKILQRKTHIFPVMQSMRI
jgi:manganese-dependent inorganic pyrophosphatase